MAVSWGDWVDVGIVDGLTWDIGISFSNLWDPFNISGPVTGCIVAAGGGAITIYDCTNDAGAQPDWWPEEVLDCSNEFSHLWEQGQIWRIEVSYQGPDGPEFYNNHWWWVGEEQSDSYAGEARFEITEAMRQRRSGQDPPSGTGDRGFRKPEDRLAEERVVRSADTVEIVELTNCWDADGNQCDIHYESSYGGQAGDNVSFGCSLNGALHKGTADNVYIEMDAACSGYDINLDEYEKYFFSGQARAYGEGNVARWEAVETFVGSAAWTGVGVNAPMIVDLSNLYIFNDLGQSADDAVIDCLGLSATAAEWRSRSPVVWQSISWDSTIEICSSWPVADEQPSTSIVQPRLNQQWASDNDEPDDDLAIIVDVGGANCDGASSPYEDALTLIHDSSLDPIDPPGVSSRPADWIGGPGVTITQDEDDFEIAGGTTTPYATWTLVTNYFDRLDAIINDQDPSWAGTNWSRPGLPTSYRLLKANAWDTGEERDEQVANWDNWAWLKVQTTGPTDCQLQIEIIAWDVTISDTHLSDSSRIDDFSYSRTEHTHTYTYQVDTSGTHYVDLRVPDEYAEQGGSIVPDLRWVKQIRITFPESQQVQNWEVNLVLVGKDGGAPDVKYQFLVPEEGDDAAQLWAAAIVDGKPCARVPDDFTKRAQQGMPYYVAVIGATSGFDLGTPLNLDQAEDYWNWQEGFSATYVTSVANTMQYEGGDTQEDKLFTLYAFDTREQRFLSSATGGGIPCAMRCKSWSTTPQVLHTFYAEKHIRGGSWCWAALHGDVDASTIPIESHWREGSGNWTLEGEDRPDTTGLITPPMVPGEYQTGLKSPLSSIVGLGVVPPREFAWYRFLVGYGVEWVACLREEEARSIDAPVRGPDPQDETQMDEIVVDPCSLTFRARVLYGTSAEDQANPYQLAWYAPRTVTGEVTEYTDNPETPGFKCVVPCTCDMDCADTDPVCLYSYASPTRDISLWQQLLTCDTRWYGSCYEPGLGAPTFYLGDHLACRGKPGCALSDIGSPTGNVAIFFTLPRLPDSDPNAMDLAFTYITGKRKWTFSALPFESSHGEGEMPPAVAPARLRVTQDDDPTNETTPRYCWKAHVPSASGAIRQYFSDASCGPFISNLDYRTVLESSGTGYVETIGGASQTKVYYGATDDEYVIQRIVKGGAEHTYDIVSDSLVYVTANTKPRTRMRCDLIGQGRVERVSLAREQSDDTWEEMWILEATWSGQALQRLTLHPSATTTEFGYDGDGNLTSYEDCSGRVHTIGYEE